MGYPAVTFASELDPVVRKELDTFAAQLQGFLSSAGFGSDGTFSVNLRSAAVLNPVGEVIGLSHGILPDGHLWCDGKEYSRSTYSDLNAKYAAEGYLHGAGNGTTTFNVPDYRRMVLVGVETTDPLNEIERAGRTGGTWSHTHTNPSTAAQTLGELDVDGDTQQVQDNVDLTGSTVTLDPVIGGGGPTVVLSGNYSTDGHLHTANGTLKVPTGQGSHSHTQGVTGAANQKFGTVYWAVKY